MNHWKCPLLTALSASLTIGYDKHSLQHNLKSTFEMLFETMLRSFDRLDTTRILQNKNHLLRQWHFSDFLERNNRAKLIQNSPFQFTKLEPMF